MMISAVSLGSRRKECEASPVESANQVPLLELVGDHHFVRSLYSVRTAMAPWKERQHQVHAQRKPSHFTFISLLFFDL